MSTPATGLRNKTTRTEKAAGTLHQLRTAVIKQVFDTAHHAMDIVIKGRRNLPQQGLLLGEARDN
jgi:hypothetical protein